MKPRAKYKKWKLKDVEFIRRMVPVASARMIAAEMGLTEEIVRAAAKRFKVSMKRKKV